MMNLFETRDNGEIKLFLMPVVDALGHSYSSRLTCIALAGSRVVGGYRPDSDFDLCLLWEAKQQESPLAEEARVVARNLRAQGRKILDRPALERFRGAALHA